MNETPDKHAKLLAETFHGDWESGQPAAFARVAANAARRRHLARRSLQAACAATITAIAVVIALTRPSAPPLPSSARAPVAQQKSHGYEIISDEELLAQVRDRPLLALKKANGTREIVVLESGSD
jgi:hypothetical protein